MHSVARRVVYFLIQSKCRVVRLNVRPLPFIHLQWFIIIKCGTWLYFMLNVVSALMPFNRTSGLIYNNVMWSFLDVFSSFSLNRNCEPAWNVCLFIASYCMVYCSFIFNVWMYVCLRSHRERPSWGARRTRRRSPWAALGWWRQVLGLCFVAEGLLGRSGFRLKLFV